jgi:hypothetical protein
MSLRIGIVGARRQQQGIGEHVARHLAALGADVVAIVGTRPETLGEAVLALGERHGPRVRGYLDLEAMLSAERLDAVAICSPDAFHRQHLRIALAAGVHVLCEKPLVFEPGRDSLADARSLVAGFAAAGRLLMVNQQWPYTLPAFARLHPGADGFHQPPERIEMLLCPGSRGAVMIPNAMPHVLSLLSAMTPAGGEARDILVRATGPDQAPDSQIEITFDYVHGRRATAVRAVFRQATQQPRPAGYAIDGRAVRRLIDPTDYSMCFRETDDLFALSDPPDTARSVPLPDPMPLLLGNFLRRISESNRSIDPALLDCQRLLGEVYRAAVGRMPPPLSAPHWTGRSLTGRTRTDARR